MNRSISLALVFSMRLAAQTATVEGAITNAVTGAPVVRARVWLQGPVDGKPGIYRGMSGADGKFTINAIVPGIYAVHTARVGFSEGTRVREPIVLKADDRKTDVEIKLIPCGVITGRVRDAEGEPVEGANVNADGPRSGAHDVTDDRGQFRLGGLAPGRYRIRVTAGNSTGGPPEIRTDGSADVHDATTYFPSVLSHKDAGIVVVNAGMESSGADIGLVRVPFIRVSGKVVGMPARAGLASLIVSQGADTDHVSLPQNGLFTLWRLDPGKYSLRAEWNAPDGSRAHTAEVEIEVAGSNIDGIELRAAKDLKISGRIDFEDDRAKAALPKQPAQIQLLHTNGDQSDVDDADVREDGRFTLNNVTPAKYKVRINEEAVYVKSVLLASRPVDGGVLDFSSGSAHGDLSLLLSAATGSVSGVVEDDQGKPAAATVVITSAEDESGFEPRFEEAKEDGKYVVEHLPPGNYRIAAVSPGEAAVEGIEDLMEPVAVRDDEKTAKNLKLRLMNGN